MGNPQESVATASSQKSSPCRGAPFRIVGQPNEWRLSHWQDPPGNSDSLRPIGSRTRRFGGRTEAPAKKGTDP